MPSESDFTLKRPFSSVINQSAKISSAIASPIINRLPLASVFESQIFKGVSSNVISKSLVLANYLDDGCESVVDWTAHNIIELPYTNVKGYLNGVKRLVDSKDNFYLRIVMRWLTITLPALESSKFADFQEFRSRFRFDPNFMKHEFVTALQVFYEVSQRLWDITQDSKPTDILAASLTIVAHTIIRCALSETPLTEGQEDALARAMVIALREFEEENRTFSTPSAFINYVKVKIYRETLDEPEINALMLFHQVGLALYDLNAFSEQSILNRLAVVAQKGVNKWSNRAQRAVTFSSDFAQKSFDFFVQYGKLCSDVIGFDRLVLNVKEGRNCLNLKLQ